jgi:acetolactate synthase regulatory subunit
MAETESMRLMLENDLRRMRRESTIWRVLNVLEDTVRVVGMTPDTKVDDVRVEFTVASVRAIAPLCEALEILEAIIFASDGCMGHRLCAHSMEPWQQARRLLEGKWQADELGDPWPATDGTTP